MEKSKFKDATAIGFIGIPDEGTIARLEKEWGEPIKKIEKNDKIILLVGRGLFKKKIVIPINKWVIIVNDKFKHKDIVNLLLFYSWNMENYIVY